MEPQRFCKTFGARPSFSDPANSSPIVPRPYQVHSSWLAVSRHKAKADCKCPARRFRSEGCNEKLWSIMRMPMACSALARRESPKVTASLVRFCSADSSCHFCVQILAALTVNRKTHFLPTLPEFWPIFTDVWPSFADFRRLLALFTNFGLALVDFSRLYAGIV